MSRHLTPFTHFVGNRILTRGGLVHSFSHNGGRGVNVVNTVLRHPSLLVLSRPFGFLSPSSRSIVGRILTRCGHRANTAVLMSDRGLGRAASIYGHVTLLRGNMIVHSVSGDTRATRRRLRDCFGMSFARRRPATRRATATGSTLYSARRTTTPTPLSSVRTSNRRTARTRWTGGVTRAFYRIKRGRCFYTQLIHGKFRRTITTITTRLPRGFWDFVLVCTVMRVGKRRFGTRTNGGLFIRRVRGIRGNTAIRFRGILLMRGSNTVAMNTPAMRNTGMMTRIGDRLIGNRGILMFRGGEEGNRHGLGNRHRRFSRVMVGRIVSWPFWRV